MRTIAAVSTPTGPRIEKSDLLDLGAHDVLLRVAAPNVGAADALTPHLPRPRRPAAHWAIAGFRRCAAPL